MLSVSFSDLVIYFTIYSFLGWIVEMVASYAATKKVANRGFLEGPTCPVYGFGAIIILYIATPLSQNPFLVFLIALAVGFLLGWLSTIVLRGFFKAEWGKQYKNSFRFIGSAQLKNGVVSGLFALLGVYYLHPEIAKLVGLIPPEIQRVVGSFIVAAYVIDTLYSLSIIISVSEHVQEIKNYVNVLENYKAEENWYDESNLPQSIDRLHTVLKNNATDEETVLALAHLEELLDKEEPGLRRLKAYPYLAPRGMASMWGGLVSYWEERRKKKAVKISERVKLFRFKKFTAETKGDVFAEGLNFYKLVWVFTVAGVLGYVIETLYCLIRGGVLESRQGLIYGPFNQVYGLGAILLLLLLRPLAKKNDGFIFLGSAIIGGVFEYICSWVQELVFGTVSWDYGNKPFSFGGRTSVEFMLFWGILGLLYIKSIYPVLSKWIERISKKRGIVLTWVLIAVLSVDIAISALAVYRWAERQGGQEPSNRLEAILDEYYPNEMLEEIYPSMKIPEKEQQQEAE